MDSVKKWREEQNISGNARFVFFKILKSVNEMIKKWVKKNLGWKEYNINMLEGLLANLECEEENRLLFEHEQEEKHGLTLI